MEAMASGVPVVASRLSGIPELVEDGVSGLLAPPRDVEALAATLLRLHNEPQVARQLADGARLKVEREFDVQRSAATLLELMRSISAPRGTAALAAFDR
jgi:glycosyltransferase involved in cell wall biosynthesis